MTVRFERLSERDICRVTAWARDRRPFQISCMAAGRGLPHDLAGFAAEQALNLSNGFFNLTAHGATFRSGGRRLTRPGRSVILANRQGLDDAERAVHAELAAWQAGRPTTATAALDDAHHRWQATAPGQSFELAWMRQPLPRRDGARARR